MLNNCLLAIYYLRLMEEFPYVVDRNVDHEFMPGSFHKKPLDGTSCPKYPGYNLQPMKLVAFETCVM